MTKWFTRNFALAKGDVHPLGSNSEQEYAVPIILGRDQDEVIISSKEGIDLDAAHLENISNPDLEALWLAFEALL